MSAHAPAGIRERNRQLITAYIRDHGPATKQMLERGLGLSLPTITQNLKTLQDQGIIEPGDLLDSTGGRKAQPYRFASGSRSAIGVAMRRNGLTMCAIDLDGTVIARHHMTIDYTASDVYYRHVAASVQDFASSLEQSGSPALGVAFSIQGIVSADGTRVTFGSILGDTDFELDTLSRDIDLSCMLIHDSDASAMAELWFDPGIRDAVCVYLEQRPGGAVIIDGKLHQGPNQCNGTIEHMTLVPAGRPCYCGRRGCMDPYCSPDVLTDRNETLDEAFRAIRAGDPAHRERYEAWMDSIAQAIANIRSVLAGDIILGGQAAPHLSDDDLSDLKRRVIDLSPFPTASFDILRSRCAPEQNIIGAALRFVQPYIDKLCGTDTAA